MTPKLTRMRDELAQKYAEDQFTSQPESEWEFTFSKNHFKAGFTAAHDLLMPALKMVLYYVQGDATYEGLVQKLKDEYGIEIEKVREILE